MMHVPNKHQNRDQWTGLTIVYPNLLVTETCNKFNFLIDEVLLNIWHS
jgi:hypothetical protein